MMEGILVLPLYLMLLGVLFILGDLARARMTLLAVERSLTWLASDRFSGHGTDGLMRMLAVFEDKETAPVTAFRVSEMLEGDQRAGNTWLDAFMGYAVMNVKVPLWVGMANTEAVMATREPGQKGENMPFRDAYVLPEGQNGAADRQYRSFMVRRRRFDAGADYDRNAAGIRLADNVWVNVTENEPWVEGKGMGLHKMPKPRAAGQRVEYVRQMAAWGE